MRSDDEDRGIPARRPTYYVATEEPSDEEPEEPDVLTEYQSTVRVATDDS